MQLYIPSETGWSVGRGEPQLPDCYFISRLEGAPFSNNKGLKIAWVPLGGVVTERLPQLQKPQVGLGQI